MSRLLKSSALLALMGMSSPVLADTLQGTLYKNPYCTCCEGHAAYLKEHGIKVDVKEVEDLSAMSLKAGIPAKYEGCHMIMLDGYVIEGHVTADIIEKLVRERPVD